LLPERHLLAHKSGWSPTGTQGNKILIIVMDYPRNRKQRNESACERRVKYLDTDDYRNDCKYESWATQCDLEDRLLRHTHWNLWLNFGLLNHQLRGRLLRPRHDYGLLARQNPEADQVETHCSD
jgi:hypothetical protein